MIILLLVLLAVACLVVLNGRGILSGIDPQTNSVGAPQQQIQYFKNEVQKLEEIQEKKLSD